MLILLSFERLLKHLLLVPLTRCLSLLNQTATDHYQTEFQYPLN